MKKIVSLLLAILMVCLSLSALADVLPDFLGDWYLKSVNEDGESVDVSSMGITGVLSLDEEGHVTFDFAGNVATGTWAEEDGKFVVTIEDSPAEVSVLEDGNLALSAEGMQMVFSREAAEAFTLADVNPDAKPEDFNGTWQCEYVSIAGMTMSASAVLSQSEDETIAPMTFKDGHLDMGEGDISDVAGNSSIDMEFKDGAYEYTMEVAEGMSVTFRLQMLQDGMLAMIMDIAGEEMGLYFTMAEDVAAEPAA